MKCYEIKNSSQELIGYVAKFRAPAFTGLSHNFVALDINKQPLSSALPTKSQAESFLELCTVS